MNVEINIHWMTNFLKKNLVLTTKENENDRHSIASDDRLFGFLFKQNHIAWNACQDK